MKTASRNNKNLLMLICASIVVACGGGEDEEGALSAFSITPTEITLTGPNDTTCGSGYAGRVFVNGGAAPYSLQNTGPGTVELSRSTVASPGGSFDVVFLGGCFDPINVVVVDALGRQLVLSLIAEVGEAP